MKNEFTEKQHIQQPDFFSHSIPIEVKLAIFNNLKTHTLNICSEVSKTWQKDTNSSVLWKDYSAKHNLPQNNLTKENIIHHQKVFKYLGSYTPLQDVNSIAEKFSVSFDQAIMLYKILEKHKFHKQTMEAFLQSKQLTVFFKSNHYTNVNALMNFMDIFPYLRDTPSDLSGINMLYTQELINIANSNFCEIEGMYNFFTSHSGKAVTENHKCAAITLSLVAVEIARHEDLYKRISLPNNTINAFVTKLLKETTIYDDQTQEKIFNGLQCFVDHLHQDYLKRGEVFNYFLSNSKKTGM